MTKTILVKWHNQGVKSMKRIACKAYESRYVNML